MQVDKEKTKKMENRVLHMNCQFTEEETHSGSPEIKKIQITILMIVRFTLTKLAESLKGKYQVGKCVGELTQWA